MSPKNSVYLRAILLVGLTSFVNGQYGGYNRYRSMNSLGGGGMQRGRGMPGGSPFSGMQNRGMGMGGIPMNPGANLQSSCSYLKNAQTQAPVGGTAAPVSGMNGHSGAFKIFTRSRAAKVTKGTPIEVTIGPFSPMLSMFNFTSFILYAKPIVNTNLELEMYGGPTSWTNKHMGVFQLFSRWSAGAGGLSCGANSNTDDSVAAFESLIMGEGVPVPARNQVSVLWWPTPEVLALPPRSAIKFVANIQSNGRWFRLSSTPWRIHRPIDQWQLFERMFSQMGSLRQHMIAMERRLDQPV